MSAYRRIRHPGATVFLTINLIERGGDLLLRHIDLLRDVVRRTKADKPFAIDAWVVLPDHMHCLWTLPEGDSDYSNRVGMLKARFSRELRRSGDSPTPSQNIYGAVGGRRRVGLSPDLPDGAVQTRWDEAPTWQKRFWEHHIRDEADFRAHLRYCWINPVKHGLCEHPKDWPYSSYHRDVATMEDLLL
ncbi:MAG: transposase [Pseudorhodobacter sp.]|nr:transposase [Pseudorhodobacter sp.]